jgi:hypothetical protein
MRTFSSDFELGGHSGYIHSLLGTETGLISGGADKSIKLWS